jgi:hypothetical protein
MCIRATFAQRPLVVARQIRAKLVRRRCAFAPGRDERVIVGRDDSPGLRDHRR